MNQPIVLISDSHQIPVGNNAVSQRLSRLIAKFSKQILKHNLRKLERKNGSEPWVGYVSRFLYDLLPPEKQATVKAFEEEHFRYTEKADYTPLHKLADELDRQALAMGENSGLCRNEMSFFRITETRWLDPLLTEYLAYYLMITDLKKQYPNAPVLTFTSQSFIEKIAATSCKETSVIPPSFFTKLLHPIQRLAHEKKEKQAFQNSLADWLKSAPEQKLQFTGFSKNQGAKKVLFVAYKERTLSRLEKIAPQLLKEKGTEYYVLSQFKGYSPKADAAFGRLQSLGMKSLWYCEILSKSECETSIQQTNQKLEKSLTKFFSHPFQCMVGSDNLFSYFKNFLEQATQEGAALANLHAEAATRLLDVLSFDLIVNFEEWEINRAIALAARKKKIPTLAYYTISPNPRSGLVRRLQEYFACAGQDLADSFLQTKIFDPKKTKIVGDPATDDCAKISRSDCRQAICKNLNLDVQRPIIMILTTYADQIMNSSELESFYKKAIACAQDSNCQILVRPHPQQNSGQIKNLFQSLGALEVSMVPSGDLLSLAAGCDVVLGPYTSAYGQVILAKTPAIAVLPLGIKEKIRHLFDFDQAGIPVVTLEKDLKPNFEKLLKSESARFEQISRSIAYIERHTGPLDGQASSRISTYIQEILNN